MSFCMEKTETSVLATYSESVYVSKMRELKNLQTSIGFPVLVKTTLFFVVADSFYWSSSEFDDNNAWKQNFNNGNQNNDNKNNNNHVRAIRVYIQKKVTMSYVC